MSNDIKNIIIKEAEKISGIKVTEKDRKIVEIFNSTDYSSKPELYKKIYSELRKYSFSHARDEALAVLIAKYRIENE